MLVPSPQSGVRSVSSDLIWNIERVVPSFITSPWPDQSCYYSRQNVSPQSWATFNEINNFYRTSSRPLNLNWFSNPTWLFLSFILHLLIKCSMTAIHRLHRLWDSWQARKYSSKHNLYILSLGVCLHPACLPTTLTFLSCLTSPLWSDVSLYSFYDNVSFLFCISLLDWAKV